jgi:hypothetical protein
MRALEPYDQVSFSALHAPGAQLLTASLCPGLFGLLPWASRYAVAAHLTGQAPLPEPTHARIRAGRYLERAALELLAEETSEKIEQVRAYAMADELPLLASPDGVFGDDGIVEAKVISPGRAKSDWAEGPPLRVQIQHQCQFLCTHATRGFICALIVGDFQFDLLTFASVPHQGAIAKIAREVRVFMDDLAHGKLPDPSAELGNDSTIKALSAIFRPDEQKSIRLDDPSAAEKFRLWRAAAAQRKAAEETEETCRRWFQLMLGDAGKALIGNSAELTRREIQIKAHTRKASTSVRWQLHDLAGDLH